MINYVCGFLRSGKLVAMVRKTHGPAAVKGKWNGIGGRVDPDESPTDAMVREFREETGLIVPGNWDLFLLLNGKGWCVWFFAAAWSHGPALPDANDVGEKLEWRIAASEGTLSSSVPNLRWILPMSECVNSDPGLPYTAIENFAYRHNPRGSIRFGNV